MSKYLIIITLSFVFITAQTSYPQEETSNIKVGIINGRATYLPKPDFPQEAENSCASDLVKVEVEVEIKDFVGNVISAKAVSGDEVLRKSAEEAALKAKFRKTDDVDERKITGFLVYNFEPKIKCIDAGIVNKNALKIPKPQMPNLINLKHLQINKEIIVMVQITVNMEGRVLYAKALTGHPLLGRSFEMSARRTEFSPTFINGKPIYAKGFLIYKIKLSGDIEMRIDDEKILGEPINLPIPAYPFCNCKFGGKESTAGVQVEIGEEGNVISAQGISGHPIQKGISVTAAKNSKFSPTIVAGKTVKAKAILIYTFDNENYKVKGVSVKLIEPIE